MDGSTSSFLSDSPYLSSFDREELGGILYVEDFDIQPESKALPPEPAVEEVPPAYTEVDLALAREAGRREGQAVALADARLVQDQIAAAATQALADAIAASRGAAQKLVLEAAEESARMALALLQAALPRAMALHASCEVQAMLEALLPGMSCEPELRVRTHPDLADHVRDTLGGMLPAEGCLLSVVADPLLGPGDVQVAWQDGQARRDCASVWNDIRAALAPLALPGIEEVCRGRA
jgi:flagellar biosynthesis/type III secretory pathway protein FliH